MPGIDFPVGARMVSAQQAPVKPRVHVGESGALPLGDEVARLLGATGCGVVAVLGPAGSGKTTALRHLAATLPPDARLLLLDAPSVAAVASVAPHYLVVYAARSGLPVPHLAS